MKKICILFFGVICNIAFAQSSIFDIARKGTLSEVKELYSKYPDTLDSKNDAGYLPLTLACYNANNEVAAFIAEHSKDINGNSDYGTPLMASVVKGNEEMVKKLVALKADPNITDSNGTSALHYAVMFQMESIIMILIKGGANSLLKDNKGFTSVDYANKLKNEQIIKLLN